MAYYIVWATLTTGKRLTSGVVEAATPDNAIDTIRLKYARSAQNYGPVADITFSATEAPDEENDCC